MPIGSNDFLGPIFEEGLLVCNPAILFSILNIGSPREEV